MTDLYYSENDLQTFTDYADALEHHGILGQKWGVRRFQNQDGSLTDEGRERYGYGVKKWVETKGKAMAKGAAKATAKVAKSTAKAAAKTTVKAAKATVKKTKQAIADSRAKSAARKAEKAAAEEAQRRAEEEAKKPKIYTKEERDQIIQSGDFNRISEIQGQMTTEELNAAANRFQAMARLNQYAPKEKTAWDKADEISKKVNNVRNYVDTGINSWNTFAKIYNSFNDPPLTVIDGDMYGRELRRKQAERQERDARIKEQEDKAEKKRAKEIQKLVRSNDQEKIMKALASGKMTDEEVNAAQKRITSIFTMKDSFRKISDFDAASAQREVDRLQSQYYDTAKSEDWDRTVRKNRDAVTREEWDDALRENKRYDTNAENVKRTNPLWDEAKKEDERRSSERYAEAQKKVDEYNTWREQSYRDQNTYRTANQAFKMAREIFDNVPKSDLKRAVKNAMNSGMDSYDDAIFLTTSKGNVLALPMNEDTIRYDDLFKNKK